MLHLATLFDSFQRMTLNIFVSPHDDIRMKEGQVLINVMGKLVEQLDASKVLLSSPSSTHFSFFRIFFLYICLTLTLNSLSLACISFVSVVTVRAPFGDQLSMHQELKGKLPIGSCLVPIYLTLFPHLLGGA